MPESNDQIWVNAPEVKSIIENIPLGITTELNEYSLQTINQDIEKLGYRIIPGKDTINFIKEKCFCVVPTEERK